MSNQTDLTQFCAALETADSDAVRNLLARDPALAVAVLPDDWPVFLLQSVHPDAGIINLMLAHGADPNVRNGCGETLLHLTADPLAIRTLLHAGADINAPNQCGHTPMMAHAPYPDTGPDAIHTLLAAGADPNIQGHDGQTLATLLPEGPRGDSLRRALRGSR